MACPLLQKRTLEENQLLFYSVSFDESFTSELQKCQIDINVRY